MADKLQVYKNIASGLIERDRELKSVTMPAMDKLGENDWTRPDPLQKMTWLIDRVDSAPRNAEIAGVRSFATLWPNLSIVRPGSSDADKKRYNKIEDLLGYQFMLASGRPNYDMPMFGSTPTERIIRSAERYGEVAVQVVHVDAQMDLMGGVKPSRRRAIKQYGDYIINVHNPQSVHVRTSGMALEGVLLKKHQTVADFVAFWGDKAKPVIRSLKEESDWDKTYICSYDYTDYDARVIWAQVTETQYANYGLYQDSVDGIEIMREDHDMSFLPWIWRGNVEPLNYAVWETGSWDAANAAETLAYSDVIKRAAAPRLNIETPNPDGVEVDYTDPNHPMYTRPGDKVTPMQPPEINQGHVIMGDRARADIKSMTVPNVVTALDSSANEAYSTFDQRLKSGLAAYEPFKQQAERAHEEIFCHMLYWAKYLDKPISAPYVSTSSGGARSFSYDQNGQPFVLKPGEYTYDTRTHVTLVAGTPLDDQQRITAASNAVQYLGLPKNRALEMIGENNPEQMEIDRAKEALRETEVGIEIQKMQAQGAYEAQLINAGIAEIIPYVTDPNIGPQIVQMLQQFVGQMQAQQQAQSQGGGQAPPPNPENTGTGLQGVGTAVNNGAGAAQANPQGNALSNQ